MGGGRDRDDHMWPYCKERKVHDIVADDLQLTVMIGGDIVAELKAEMTRVADRYGIENVKRLHEIGAPELNVALERSPAAADPLSANAADSKSAQQRADSAMSGESDASEQFDLSFYTSCPLCGAALAACGREEAEAHLTNHYAEQIREKISESSDPLGDGSACPECGYDAPAADGGGGGDLVLHYGVAHGATAELLVEHVKSVRQTKAVALPLNFEKVCRICRMDFGFKNVDPSGIRTHFLTHHNYRQRILEAAGEAHERAGSKLRSGIS